MSPFWRFFFLCSLLAAFVAAEDDDGPSEICRNPLLKRLVKRGVCGGQAYSNCIGSSCVGAQMLMQQPVQTSSVIYQTPQVMPQVMSQVMPQVMPQVIPQVIPQVSTGCGYAGCIQQAVAPVRQVIQAPISTGCSYSGCIQQASANVVYQQAPAPIVYRQAAAPVQQVVQAPTPIVYQQAAAPVQQIVQAPVSTGCVTADCGQVGCVQGGCIISG